MPVACVPAVDGGRPCVYGKVTFFARSRPPLPLLYWEDFSVGSVAEFGPRLVTREEIIAFAAEFDPQPMHMDEDFARTTMLGGLAASGWHTCAIGMRLMADGFILDAASMGSPGIDEVRWLKPVRPGDRLTLRRAILDARPLKSRPEWGLVRFRYEMFNQSGELLMTQENINFFGRRNSAS
jgi:acyl dehydratase